jgi:hypothetical protein
MMHIKSSIRTSTVMVIWIFSISLLWHTLSAPDASGTARVLNIVDIPVNIADGDGTKLVTFRAFRNDADMDDRVTVFCRENNLIQDQCSRFRTHLYNRLAAGDEYGDGGDDRQHQDLREAHRYCFVSAFWSISRAGWANRFTAEKSLAHYMDYHEVLLHMQIPLVVFIDSRLHDDLLDRIRRVRPAALHTVVVPIDESFLREHILSSSCLDVEQRIMRSEAYQRISSQRPHLDDPETVSPEYNGINFAKHSMIALESLYRVQRMHAYVSG